MRFLFVSLLSLALVVPSFATVDPDPDQIGIYFDTNADITCLDAAPSTVFYAYVIITHPTSTAIRGVEFSLCEEVEGGNSAYLFRLIVEWVHDPIWDPINYDWCGDGVAMGFGTPLPQEKNVLLVTLGYLLLAPVGVDFYLGPYSPESNEDGLPAYLGADNEAIPLGVSSGDPDLPVASVNGCNVVSVEGSSFGDLKCLFR